MPEREVFVVGVGMQTAVGLTAPETAASVRAATMRFNESSIHDRRFDPVTLAQVPDDALPPLAEPLEAIPELTGREIRMLRLAAPALAECLAAAAGGAGRPGLTLALPEAETLLPLDRPAFLERLAIQTGDRFDPVRSTASCAGRAGGLLAVDRAAETIRSGQASFAIAGGVDTYRDLFILGGLDLEKRLKSATNLDGFVPGEGAGFLLLASRSAAEHANLQPLSRVSTLALGFEDGHLYSPEPYLGEGLSEAIRQIVEASRSLGAIKEVYSSMNGENHWAKEWGVGFLRNHGSFDPEHGFHHPADCYGDPGTAAGPLMVGLAAMGIHRGYRESPALVYCSSDRGHRAALTVATA